MEIISRLDPSFQTHQRIIKHNPKNLISDIKTIPGICLVLITNQISLSVHIYHTLEVYYYCDIKVNI